MNARKLSDVYSWIKEHSHYFDDDLNDADLIDVNQISWNGDFPLHIVARAGRVDDVDALLDHGAQIDARGERGMTSLHYAAMCGQVEVIRSLMRRGAEIASRDDDGRTPLDWAVAGGHREVVAILKGEST